jgi:Zn-finger nucleic acid-binding protein
MHCPDCETLLRTEAAPGREVCPDCTGEWFDLPVLAVALRNGDPAAGSSHLPPADPTPGPPRRCPVCRAVLRRRDWAGTLPPESVALCPLGHGAWLPSGGRARLREAAGRARHLLRSRATYFMMLARGAARDFERATRPCRRGRRSARFPLARLLG